MKFIDEAVITVQSGNGGSGCVSFRREKFIPKGGPDGGDGGDGGDVILRVSPGKRTLHHFCHKTLFRSEHGQRGRNKQKTGKKGIELVIDVPTGTVVFDADTGRMIGDFIEPGKTSVLARGGRGGRGNARFKSATHRTPRFAQPGEPGETLQIRFELKLLADVGIAGLPNAGKSTLINAISSSKAKIGSYPFTTLTPNLGVVDPGAGEPFVVADVPGLIKGAHQGAGLGIQFLKHLERTRIIIHLIDASTIEAVDPLKSFKTIVDELVAFKPALGEKGQL
ncbi:MAG: GTPase ObgE, partial [Deltaproteobacteria bacterium]|nr:GTPase ObgE [Deltaproteobacteria bacterium]